MTSCSLIYVLKFYKLSKLFNIHTHVSVAVGIKSVVLDSTERRHVMTRNQIAWQNLLEARRSAIASQEETTRHNREWENENRRHNMRGEELSQTANEEQRRHNREFESIHRESNRDARTAKLRDYKLASDRLFQDATQFSRTMEQRRRELDEARRKRENESAVAVSRQNEYVRANRASEAQRRNELRHRQRVDRFYAQQEGRSRAIQNFSSAVRTIGDVFKIGGTIAGFFV